MLQPAEFDALPRRLSRLLLEMENYTIQDIARRLFANEAMTRTADYQLKRLQELATFEGDWQAYVDQIAARIPIEIDIIFSEAAELAYVWDKKLYEAKGIPFVPLSENKPLQQLLHSAQEQFKKEIGTLTNSRAIKMVNPYGRYVPIPQCFADTLDSVAFQTASGVTSYDEAIKRAVRDLAGSGLRTVRYETPGKRPVNRKIEGVARANVLTSIANMAAEISMHNMDELGAEHVVVSAHATARPSHLIWQGGVYHFPKYIRDIVRTGAYEVAAGPGDGKYRDLIAATRYTYADGLEGVHCRHSYGAFDIEFSTNPYSEKELQAFRDAEEKKTAYKSKTSTGKEQTKEYSPSEAAARQREMERQMRYTRAAAKGMKAGGQEDAYQALKAKYSIQRKEYERFSKAMGIITQYERVYMDGLGRI